MVITDSYFTANNKSLFLYKSGHLNVSGCSFYSNSNGLWAWEANGTVNNCSFVANENDYITKAAANLSISDCYYSYGYGNVNWSYEEKELQYLYNDTFLIEDIAIGDVNGDGYNDIVVVNMSWKEADDYNHSLSVYLYNTTTDEFDAPITQWLYTCNVDDRSLTLESIDGDNECEIFIAYENITVLDWDGATWVETAYSPFGNEYTHSDIKVRDVDDDNFKDVVTVSEGSDKAVVYLWDNPGNEFDLSHSLTTLSEPVTVYVNDTDDDNLYDLIVNYASGPYISTFNQTVAGFDARYDMEFDNPLHCEELITDDLNGDDKNDILVQVRNSTTGYELHYRLWNSTSGSFDEETKCNGTVFPFYDMEYFDCDDDGNDEVIGCSWGTEIAIYNITDFNITRINFFGDLQSTFHILDRGYLDDDGMIDLVCGGTDGSVLIWDDSCSETARNIRVNVRNDTDVGVDNARVIITDPHETEVFNETANTTGYTPVKRIVLSEENLSSEDRYYTFRMNVHKLSGGTWYNITRFLNITPFTGIREELIYIGNDTDNDGLTDGRETYVLESNASNNDSDGDGILDGTENSVNATTKPSTTGVGFVADEDINSSSSVISNDTDSDGLTDGIEDSDADGKQDSGETDPNDWDSDDDTLPDGWIDYDNDEIKDLCEYEDYDLDGVVDSGGWGAGGETDPLDNDTDGGGMDDNIEIWNDQDPLDSSDDGGTRGLTRSTRSGEGEEEEDSDGDGIPDDEELDGSVLEIGEFGSAEVTYTIGYSVEDWYFARDNVVKLKKQGGYQNPVVMAMPLSWDPDDEEYGNIPVVPMIRWVRGNSFNIFLTHWWYYQNNTQHYGNETVNYLVLEEGEYTLADGTELKVGTVTAGHWWKEVTFDNSFSSTPIVFTQGQTSVNGDWMPFMTRTRDISASGFEVAMSHTSPGRTGETIGYVAIDPIEHDEICDLGNIQYQVGTVEDVSTDLAELPFDSFDSNPNFIAAIQNGNDLDMTSDYQRNTFPENLRYLVENGETKMRIESTPWNGVGKSNTNTPLEDIGYIAFNGSGQLTKEILIGETGTIDFDTAEVDSDGYVTQTLDNYYDEPVVIAKPFEYGDTGKTPVHVRIKDVSERSFKIKIEKWDYDSGNHSGNIVNYVIMESGNYVLSNGKKVEIGTRNVSDVGTPISFLEDFFPKESEIIVFAQSQTCNDTEPIITRVHSITPNGFQAIVQEEGGGRHGYNSEDDVYEDETIGYIALEPTSGNFGDSSTEFLFNKCDDEIRDIGEGNPTEIDLSSLESGNPLFIAEIQSLNDDHAAELRFGYASTDANGVSNVKVSIEDEKAMGASVHEAEEIAFLAFTSSCSIYAEKIATDPNDLQSVVLYRQVAASNTNTGSRTRASFEDNDDDGWTDNGAVTGSWNYQINVYLWQVYLREGNDDNNDDEIYVIIDDIRYPYYHYWQEDDPNDDVYAWDIDTDGGFRNPDKLVATRSCAGTDLVNNPDGFKDDFFCWVQVWEADNEWDEDWSGNDGIGMKLLTFGLDYDGRDVSGCFDGKSDRWFKWCTFYEPGWWNAEVSLTFRIEVVPFDDPSPLDVNGDDDGDGITDEFEYDLSMHPDDFDIPKTKQTLKYDIGQSSLEYDFPGYLGIASPTQKDLFVEVDNMDDHEMPAQAKYMVCTKFRDSGTEDTSSLSGSLTFFGILNYRYYDWSGDDPIWLRIDTGGMGGGNGIYYNFGNPLSMLSVSGPIDFYDYKNGYDSNGDGYYSDKNDIKPQFNDIRNGIFRYCIVAPKLVDNHWGLGPEVNKWSDGDDFAISADKAWNSIYFAYTFMHELGHKLGLNKRGHHPVPFEGIDSDHLTTYKSCMNYNSLFVGLVDYSDGSEETDGNPRDSTGADHDDWGTIKLDYFEEAWDYYEG